MNWDFPSPFTHEIEVHASDIEPFQHPYASTLLAQILNFLIYLHGFTRSIHLRAAAHQP